MPVHPPVPHGTFIQIAANNGAIYALDDLGRVWWFDMDARRWEQVPEDRE